MHAGLLGGEGGGSLTLPLLICTVVLYYIDSANVQNFMYVLKKNI